MKEYKSTIPEYRLAKVKTSIKKVKIQSSKDSYQYVMQFYKGDIEIYESVFLLLMNNANNTIGWVKISQGGISATIIDPKIVGYYCIKTLASTCILCHNHPSGSITPSNADKNITKRVQKALEYINVTLIDHLVVTKDKYMSFADEGLL